MFEISVLKEMKLSELQEIAKAANITKITGVKKEALINQILQVQASFSEVSSEVSSAVKSENTNDTKPKRARISVDQKAESMSLFSESSEQVIENKKVLILWAYRMAMLREFCEAVWAVLRLVPGRLICATEFSSIISAMPSSSISTSST